MLIQLNPVIPLETPKGFGYAYFLIDEGIDHDLHWVVFQNDTRECWTWLNSHVRAAKNITLDRTVAIDITASKKETNDATKARNESKNDRL